MRISDWSSDVCSSDLKVDRVRIEYPRAAEQVRIMKLQRQRFPAASGGALDDAPIGLIDQAERLFQIGHQFLGDRIAPRTVVRRIERVGFDEEGARRFQGDPDHARKILSDPFLREDRKSTRLTS